MVSLGEVEDRGVRGELRALFFNGQLASTWFYPSDAGRYVETLQRDLGRRLSPDGIEVRGGRIWLGTDGGKDFVAWRDSELERQRLSLID